MKLIVSENFEPSRSEILCFLEEFNRTGDLFLAGSRNKIKIFELQGMQVNIKSFKVPNVVNKVVYRFLRKSKAERSFFYAKELLRKGIGTPEPIAYAEESSALTFGKSFYVSEHLDCDLTFRDLDLKKEGHEDILRAFTRFTFQLHEKGIEFLDHSPGNTLIKIKDGQYEFYLVDLNRMNFKALSYKKRLQNFKRLSREKRVYEIMADEYAKIMNRPSAEVFEQMWHYNQEFFNKLYKKARLKRKLKGK